MVQFKMDMSDAVQQTTGDSNTTVDWDAMNDYVIECAKTEKKPRSLKGVISGIMDLGIQVLEPFEELYKGTDDQDKRLASGAAHIKEEGGKQIFVAPQKPTKQVAITVDFPAIKLNKSQFFENGDDRGDEPLRLLLNGEYWDSKISKRVVGRGYSIKERKHDDGTWAFAKNNQIHKLADAVGLLDEEGYFTKDRLGELIGECAQFTVRVYLKPNKKDPNKVYYTEEVKLNGMIAEDENTGEVVLPVFDEGILYNTNFNQVNKPSYLKQLRASVKNTMALATNYDESIIKKELGDKGSKPAKTKEADVKEPIKTPTKQAEKADDKWNVIKMEETAKAAKAKLDAATDFDAMDFDADIPF